MLTAANTTAGKNDVLLTATYNAQHEPLTIVGANGKTTSYVYNAAGQVTQLTDAAGDVTTLTYDPKGYLTTVQGPVAGATYTLSYDNVGRVASATDAGGMTSTFAYDAADRPTGATFPDGTSSKLTYNLLDLATMTDRLGQSSTLTFDAQRELTAVSDALGQTTKYAYSAAGKLASLTDANGHTTTWTQDGQERVTGKTYADGTSETTTYEASLSRVHQMADADGQTTTYGYAADDNLLSVVRAKAGATTETLGFAYDAAYARPTKMTDAIGVTAYGYFPVGGLGANQLQSVTSPVAGAPAGTLDTVTMVYDALGRQVNRTVDGAVVTTAFDALGRTTTVTSPLDTFTYAYADGTARVSGVTSTHGPSFAFTYDDPKGDTLLKEIDVTAGDKSSLAQLGYTYNADDNVVSFTQSYLGKAVTAASGSSGALIGPLMKGLENKPETTSQEKSATTWKSVAETAAAAAILVFLMLFGLRRNARGLGGGWLAPVMLGLIFLGCGHDSASGIGGIGGTQYLYDTTNRVTAATGEGAASYTYDAASNLTSITSTATPSQTLTYASTNAISSSGAAYDKSGNPTSLDGTTYTWDVAHRISSSVSGAHESDFSYDGLSRLVRIVDKNAGAVTADKAYVWCGAERCAAHDNLQSSSPISTRYFGEGIVDGGASYYYVKDRLGSVRQLVDASGKVRAEYDYDPYGNRTKLAGDLDTEIGYAGYFHHAADPSVNGLDFALYRAYDTRHARWLNRDSIGEADGINLYGYTSGNPLNYIDTSGDASRPLVDYTFISGSFAIIPLAPIAINPQLTQDRFGHKYFGIGIPLCQRS